MIAFVMFLFVAAGQTPPAYATPDLKGKLYRTVFLPGVGTLSADDLKALPPAVRDRLTRFLERRSKFTSRLQGTASSMTDVAVQAKKRRLEGAIVSVVESPGIEKLAADYAEQASVANEWGRDAGPPTAEAAFAEDFLKKDPSTPLAPFLYLFIADRHRAAFETLDVNVAKDKALMTAASKKYRTFMVRARSAADPIFTLLADDMDRQAYLYMKSTFHPRDFDPDS